MQHPPPAVPSPLQWPGRVDVPPPRPAGLVETARWGEGPPTGRLFHGDNLLLLDALAVAEPARLDLVYLDPPFHTGASWRLGRAVRQPGPPPPAYDDPRDLDAWLSALWVRLHRIRTLLAPDGSLFVHVDWRTAPYVQLLLDELFGPGERSAPGAPGFRAEIVWGYGGGGAPNRTYRRKHDNLFWYSRGERWTFHPQYRPYTEKTLHRGLTAVKGPGYRLRAEGAGLSTWWTDPAVQKVLSPTARENRKYPTQKPEGLLERIIQGHSDPGDLVADPYCGSGTTAAVAVRLGRRWLAADSADAAIRITRERLEEAGAPYVLLRPDPATSTPG